MIELSKSGVESWLLNEEGNIHLLKVRDDRREHQVVQRFRQPMNFSIEILPDRHQSTLFPQHQVVLRGTPNKDKRNVEGTLATGQCIKNKSDTTGTKWNTSKRKQPKVRLVSV